MPTHCIAERSPRVWHETHPYCLGCALHAKRPSIEDEWIKPELEHIGSAVFVCRNFKALPVEEIARTAVAGSSVEGETSGVRAMRHIGGAGDGFAARQPLAVKNVQMAAAGRKDIETSEALDFEAMGAEAAEDAA